MRNIGKLEIIACYCYFFIGVMILPSVISGRRKQCNPTTKLQWKNVNVTVTVRGIQYINQYCRIRIPEISQCTGYCNSEDILDLKTLDMKSACHCCKIQEITEIVTPPHCQTSRGYQFLPSIKDYTYIKVKSCRCKTNCNDTEIIKSYELTPQNSVNLKTNDSYVPWINTTEFYWEKVTPNDSRIVTSEFFLIAIGVVIQTWLCCFVF